MTRLHALDGACYLRDARHAGAPAMPAGRASLLRHHRSRRTRTRRRPEPRVQASAVRASSVLTFCDMTTSPDGEPVPVEQRLAEIQHRYGPGHLISRSIQRATPMILSAVKQVRNRAAHTA